MNGTFSPVQRELYTFYLGVYEAILYSIKPHVTAQAILQDAVPEDGRHDGDDDVFENSY